jgi:hypothetical protein
VANSHAWRAGGYDAGAKDLQCLAAGVLVGGHAQVYAAARNRYSSSAR